MPSDVIRLPIPVRPAASDAAPPSPRPAPAAQVACSLALFLRAAPPQLQPARVAADMIAAGSNAAAGPVWLDRRDGFRELSRARRLRYVAARQLEDEWRAAIRVEGIAAKARRRADDAALVQFFLNLPCDPRGGAA